MIGSARELVAGHQISCFPFFVIDPFAVFSTFDMDKLRKIRRHHWKERLNLILIKLSNLKVIRSLGDGLRKWYFVSSTKLRKFTDVCVVRSTFVPPTIRSLRPNNGDVHENVAEKQTPHPIKPFRDYPRSQLLKWRQFMLELKRGDRPRVQTEMVEFIAFRSPPQKNLKFGYFTS